MHASVSGWKSFDSTHGKTCLVSFAKDGMMAVCQHWLVVEAKFHQSTIQRIVESIDCTDRSHLAMAFT